MATINCVDCGAERRNVPTNTRYCKPCRLLRDLDFWRSRTRDCMECGEVFAPLRRSDARCARHADDELRTRAVDCLMCGNVNQRPVMTQIPVCYRCLRDPTKRGRLVRALERGQAQRREARDGS
jgi:hypothetical protein